VFHAPSRLIGMNPTDLVVPLVLATLLALIAVELLRPARKLEPVKGWRLKGSLFLVLMLVVGTVVPALFASLLPEVKLIPGHRLGLLGGTAFGIVASELVVYWVHRLHHRVDFLWRWVHQMHHSAERMDVFGAGFFHPFEMIESAVLAVLVGAVLLGLSPEAAGLVGAWQAFNAFFQHGNIRTPTWLGYLIQRPEQHGVHHERGVHAFNYANLPLWDLVFGTFKNPATWDAAGGFYPGSSKQTLPMLLGKDISNAQPSRTRAAEASAAAPAAA
jgi:sterol desaturase/sphingolipid hydroxylase (fatty acid hydroxylase superfamily)